MIVCSVRAAFYVSLALALLYVAGAWGAMEFNGTSEKATAGTAEVTATPLTMCCWGKSPANTSDDTLINLTKTTAQDGSFELLFRGNAVGDPISAGIRGTAFAEAVSSTGFSTNTWHLACGTYASSTSRSAYIDGGSKGTGTDNRTPASIARTNIAVYSSSSDVNFFEGHLAECGIWNVALSDAEVTMLGKGFAPPCVNRSALVAYYPMVRDATSLKDLFSATANHLTLTGGTVSDHPPMIRCQ